MRFHIKRKDGRTLMANDGKRTLAKLESLLDKRILVLDGAMGTMIQSFGLTEADFRGGRFASHDRDLKGNNDLLCLSKPEVIEDIHTRFLEAGADILETCSFNSNRFSQADYGLEGLTRELNLAAAAVARRAADRMTERTPDKPRFVAGILGPTGKTASISPDVHDPGHRDARFDDFVAVYKESAAALIDGGVDILMVETVFDTLNCKAALFAVQELLEERGCVMPLMVSATIADASGRTLTGQTPEAFWISVSHAPLLSVGLNCALGPAQMRPYLHDLSECAWTRVSAHPNAGLPDAFGRYTQTPERMAEVMKEFAASGFLNIAGGCCGTTPGHIRAIAQALEGMAPRKVPARKPYCFLSGLEAFAIKPDSVFVNVGERTNVTGSKKFARLIKEGKMEEALSVAAGQIEAGAQIVDVNMDEGMLDSAKAMREFLDLAAAEPDICRVPAMVDSSKWEVIEAGIKCVQGKCVINSISLKEGEVEFKKKARLARRHGAAVVVMAFDEKGQADTRERKIAICERSYKILVGELGFHPTDIIFDPNVFAVATGIEEHNNYAVDFIEATREIKQRLPGALVSGGVSNLSFSFRGNDPLREALHAVFLYHAIRAGMSMGIVNAGQLAVYEEIAPSSWSWSRTWCSTAAPTPPTACWRWPSASRGRRRRRTWRRPPGARCPARSASPTPWSKAWRTSSRPTSRKPGWSSAARSRLSRGR